MKELVAYLTQNIKLILLLTAGLVAALVFASQTMQVFPPNADPFEAATEDINLGIGELMEANISGNLPLPPLTVANVLVEWQPHENCEELPSLHIRFDLKNATSEQIALPSDFGLLFILFSEEPDSANSPIAGVKEVLVTFSRVELPTTTNDEQDHLILPGGQIHYEEVINHPDLAWLPTGSNSGAPAFPNNLTASHLLILGYPEIAGNFKETAEGETGHNATPEVKGVWVIGAQGIGTDQESQPGTTGIEWSLNAFDWNATGATYDTDGTEHPTGYLIFPAGIDPSHPEWPNLVFFVPDATEDEPPPNASYGFFVFRGGAPAGWDGVTQFEAADFDFITPLIGAREELGLFWFFEQDNAEHILDAPQFCTPTATPADFATQGSSTVTAASPQATETPTRTTKPTERSTPTPKPKPTE